MITFLFARLARAVSKKRPGEKSLWGWWWPPYARIGGPELRRFLAAWIFYCAVVALAVLYYGLVEWFLGGGPTTLQVYNWHEAYAALLVHLFFLATCALWAHKKSFARPLRSALVFGSLPLAAQASLYWYGEGFELREYIALGAAWLVAVICHRRYSRLELADARRGRAWARIYARRRGKEDARGAARLARERDSPAAGMGCSSPAFVPFYYGALQAPAHFTCSKQMSGRWWALAADYPLALGCCSALYAFFALTAYLAIVVTVPSEDEGWLIGPIPAKLMLVAVLAAIAAVFDGLLEFLVPPLRPARGLWGITALSAGLVLLEWLMFLRDQSPAVEGIILATALVPAVVFAHRAYASAVSAGASESGHAALSSGKMPPELLSACRALLCAAFMFLFILRYPWIPELEGAPVLSPFCASGASGSLAALPALFFYRRGAAASFGGVVDKPSKVAAKEVTGTSARLGHFVRARVWGAWDIWARLADYWAGLKGAVAAYAPLLRTFVREHPLELLAVLALAALLVTLLFQVARKRPDDGSGWEFFWPPLAKVGAHELFFFLLPWLIYAAAVGYVVWRTGVVRWLFAGGPLHVQNKNQFDAYCAFMLHFYWLLCTSAFANHIAGARAVRGALLFGSLPLAVQVYVYYTGGGFDSTECAALAFCWFVAVVSHVSISRIDREFAELQEAHFCKLERMRAEEDARYAEWSAWRDRHLARRAALPPEKRGPAPVYEPLYPEEVFRDKEPAGGWRPIGAWWLAADGYFPHVAFLTTVYIAGVVILCWYLSWGAPVVGGLSAITVAVKLRGALWITFMAVAGDCLVRLVVPPLRGKGGMWGATVWAVALMYIEALLYLTYRAEDLELFLVTAAICPVVLAVFAPRTPAVKAWARPEDLLRAKRPGRS